MSSREPIAGLGIPGYDYGSRASATSPVSAGDLAELERTMGWSAADADVLRRYSEVFRERAEAMVDAWRAVIGSQAHLSRWFLKPDGGPDEEYKARVRRRFIQWVVDVATRPHDREWLDYQHEIGLRHTPAKKNKTDGAQTPHVVPFRFLLGFVPVVLPIRVFIDSMIQDEVEIAKVEDAWTKAVLLHVTLWSRAYVAEDLW